MGSVRYECSESLAETPPLLRHFISLPRDGT